MSARKNPPFLTRSTLTGRVYIVTRYTKRADDGMLVASEKFDVTPEFEAIAAQARVDEGGQP